MAKKLTVADILEKKEVIKPLEMTYYSEALGGEIEIKEIDADKVCSLIQEQAKIGEYKASLKLIYACCPLFQSKEFYEHFKPVEPFEIVKCVFGTNISEVYQLSNKILTIYGFLPRTDVETVKKQ